MIKIVNKYIPFKGYKSVMLLGFLFIRRPYKLNRYEYNHERIHLCQMFETLIIPYYGLYIINFLVNLARFRNWRKAYKSVAFEQEAYSNMNNLKYLRKRNVWAWLKYIK